MAAAIVLGTLAGCSSSGTSDVEALALAAAPERPDVLYNQGLANLEGGRLSEASAKFQAIDRQHPYTDWSRKALVMSAFASYRAGDFDEAVTSSKRYVSLYPDSDEAAYAQYIMGLAYFRQMSDVTRDQRATAQAATAFRAVFENYPDSEYAEDSRAKLRIARDQLAGKEMQVGRYYLERREYLAAVSRFKNVVDVYPESRQVEEALYRLTEAYYAMGLVREAQASASVLGQNYPDSQWYSDAYALLQGNGYSPEAGASDSWFGRASRAITGA